MGTRVVKAGTRMVRVRRKRSMRIFWTVVLLMLTLGVYIVFGLPAITEKRQSVDADAPAAVQDDQTPAERVSESVQFDGMGLYMIQFGSFDDVLNARVESARYVRRGAAGYILTEGDHHRVIGAGYETREEAERVQTQLKENEDIASEVYEITCSDVLMRVTATREQIDSLINADATLRAATAEMGKMAFQLDKGKLTVLSVCERLKDLEKQAIQARKTLEGQAGETPNTVAAGLIGLLAKFEEASSQIYEENDKSELDFSSRIKYNYIKLRIDHIGFMNSLAE